MSAGQWRVPRALTVALLVALLVTSVLAAPAAAQMSDGTGDGSGDGYGTSDGTGTRDGTGEAPQPRTLVLEPGTGPPGTPVTVSGDGFGACRSRYDDVSSGAVEITWDGSSLATVGVDRGRVAAVIQVPDPAPPGTATVAGTCLGDPQLTGSAEFTVTAPGRTTDPAETTDDTARATDGTTPATGGTTPATDGTTPATGGTTPATVTWTCEPHLDLLVDGTRVATLDFRLALAFDLVGVVAVVRLGDLVALRGGECTITASLALHGQTLVQRQERTPPAVVLPLDPPVSLLGGGAEPGGPERGPAPTDRAASAMETA